MYAASEKESMPSFLTLSYRAGGMTYTMYEWSVRLDGAEMERNFEGLSDFLSSIANMSEPGEEGKRVGQALADDFKKKHRKELRAMQRQDSGASGKAGKIVLLIIAGVSLLVILLGLCSV